MAKLIIFCGLQLSGKTILAQRISKITQIPFLRIDEVRQKLYGYLSSPRDWKTEKIRRAENEKTKFAYDCLFLIIDKCLGTGVSLVVEMPHLGNREKQLLEIIQRHRTNLKILWCEISTNEKEEVRKRCRDRKSGKTSAALRERDYWMFKKTIAKPTLSHLTIDTFQKPTVCVQKIREYLNK